MTFSRRWALAAGAAAVVVIWSCTDSFQSVGPVAAPDSVTAVALGIHSIELTWSPSADASGYIIERRAKLSGAFATVQTFSSGFVNRFVDDSLDPETIYGYRVVTVA
ncbi:MAG TPA: fibronectin type III domain-containing protein, partial [Gemmatimonadales bacterium]|nr:fibronectin type III domain-containing protein [Gemmatimonadales bacterium]